MVTCNWCKTHFPNWSPLCPHCGGSMPPPLGTELGPEPPPAPRDLPGRLKTRTLWSKNILLMVGTGFFVLGGFFSAVFISQKNWAALIPLAFGLVGLLMMISSLIHACNFLRAYKHGRAVIGTVKSVGKDTSQKINNRHPWYITYSFDVDGKTCEGRATTYDMDLSRRAHGQDIWVIYLPQKPKYNCTFPAVC